MLLQRICIYLTCSALFVPALLSLFLSAAYPAMSIQLSTCSGLLLSRAIFSSCIIMRTSVSVIVMPVCVLQYCATSRRFLPGRRRSFRGSRVRFHVRFLASLVFVQVFARLVTGGARCFVLSVQRYGTVR